MTCKMRKSKSVEAVILVLCEARYNSISRSGYLVQVTYDITLRYPRDVTSLGSSALRSLPKPLTRFFFLFSFPYRVLSK